MEDSIYVALLGHTLLHRRSGSRFILNYDDCEATIWPHVLRLFSYLSSVKYKVHHHLFVSETLLPVRWILGETLEIAYLVLPALLSCFFVLFLLFFGSVAL